MGWGATFHEAYAGASAVGRVAADRTVSSVEAAGDAVARTATALAQAIGEVANTAVGGAVSLALSAYGGVKRLFTGPSPPVRSCPLRMSVDITKNAYRKTLVNSTFDGAGDPRLGVAMNALRKPVCLSDAEADPYLKTIAELRQRPIEDVRADYQRYVQLSEDQADRIAHNRAEPIDELKSSQDDFMGSNWQLRYGKVVGDYLGVDPVFGAMLNPTGGLVGPGNKGVAPDDWYMPEAVAYHGAYHDAMGYLYNYQNVGPG